MKSKINNHNGYTLIELLTVITIIGILASIALPNYRGYRDKAKMVTIYATMHQIMLAQEVYWTDFGRFFPDSPMSGTGEVLSIANTDLKISVPNGQTWTIASVGDEDSPVKSYTVSVTTNFDRDQNGIADSFFYNRTSNASGNVVTTDIPNLQ